MASFSRVVQCLRDLQGAALINATSVNMLKNKVDKVEKIWVCFDVGHNKLCTTVLINATSVNMFENKVDKYFKIFVII